MEERSELASHRIDRRHVRPFEPIAVTARQTEINEIVRPLMLPRTNMLDVEASPRLIRLRQATVLARVAGPLAHKIANGVVHPPRPWRRNTCRAFDCMMLMKSIA